MPTISIAMIAHNEAHCIEASFLSVAWADEIVVVDCGSTDSTAEISRRYATKVVMEPNRENLNINKNIAIESCQSDWIFVLDADETVSDDLAGEIRTIMNDQDAASGYLVPRRNYVMGRWMKNGGNYPDWQLRLFKNGRGKFAAKHVHERISIDGAVRKIRHPFDHHPYTELKQMFAKGAFYVNFEAQYMHEKGMKYTPFKFLIQGVIKPQIRFYRRYIFKGGFLDGLPGFATSALDWWNMTMRWVRLWEIQKAGNNSDD